MTTNQIQWNRNPQNQDDGLSATFTLSCRPDGSIHMETPGTNGGFRGDYKSPEEAANALANALNEGVQQVSNG